MLFCVEINISMVKKMATEWDYDILPHFIWPLHYLSLYLTQLFNASASSSTTIYTYWIWRKIQYATRIDTDVRDISQNISGATIDKEPRCRPIIDRPLTTGNDSQATRSPGGPVNGNHVLWNDRFIAEHSCAAVISSHRLYSARESTNEKTVLLLLLSTNWNWDVRDRATLWR